MSFRIPKLTDYQLKGCIWQAPDGSKFLPMPYTVPWYFHAAASSIKLGVEQAFHSEFDFYINAIGGIQNKQDGDVTYIQVQWPDGRYLSNPGLPVWDFIGTGMRGFCIESGERVAHGSKVKLNVDNSGNDEDCDIALFFEGVLLVPMVNV